MNAVAGQWSRDYQRIERAIRWLDAHWQDHPSLDDCAAAVNLSPYHFQRLFTDWAGVSPKRFLGFLTVAHARRVLAESVSVLDTALEVGLSGPSRLHDLFVSFEALTPGEAKMRGRGVTLRWGLHPSPFGDVVLLASPRGICGMTFVGEDGPEGALASLCRRWPLAEIAADSGGTAPLAAAAFGPRTAPLRLHISGTNFQVKVWEALLRIPPGRLVDYRVVAGAVGCPGAARAVGNAMRENPIAYVIPCHRVIRATGAFNTYRWGTERRRAIIGWEAARTLGE